MILRRFREANPLADLRPVVSAEEILRLQAAVRQVFVHPAVEEYIVRLTNATRTHPEVELGASPRGSIAMMRLSQALTALEGRDYVIPEDIRRVAVPALSHRLTLSPDRQLRGTSPEAIVKEILEANPAPMGKRKTETP